MKNARLEQHIQVIDLRILELNYSKILDSKNLAQAKMMELTTLTADKKSQFDQVDSELDALRDYISQKKTDVDALKNDSDKLREDIELIRKERAIKYKEIKSKESNRENFIAITRQNFMRKYEICDEKKLSGIDIKGKKQDWVDKLAKQVNFDRKGGLFGIDYDGIWDLGKKFRENSKAALKKKKIDAQLQNQRLSVIPEDAGEDDLSTTKKIDRKANA
jgi:hypothetical protein